MDEETFLAAIRAMPNNRRTRLVYADWLDENGQPEKAEFLRLQNEQLAIGERLKQLAAALDATWQSETAFRQDVVVHFYSPANKLALIKLAREWTGMGLAEAKAHVEQPFPIRFGRELTPERAAQLRMQISWVATATVETPPPG